MADDLSERQRDRIGELFAAAIDLNPGDQENFVNQETADEPELRPHVLKLLSHSKGAADRIAEIIQNTALSIQPLGSWIGRRFGPYCILREVGRGGMGIVFEAERDDHEYTKRVALKIASSLGGAELMQDRFRHERQ